MSLKVWLPLDGDLRNLGTSNGNFSIKTALTYTDNGKIGKAYSGGAITMDANTAASILNNQEFSFTCWVYINSTEGSTSNTGMFFGNSSMGENNNRKFSIFQYPTCNDLHLSWMNDTASTTFIGGVWAGVFPSYKWTHIAVTYKNPNCTIYVNGAKYDTRTGTSSSSSFGYETYLFQNAPNQTRYLNDYRIYDHCLSAAEVHEIAQGLISHYKLDGNGFGNPNLLAKYVVPGQAAPTSTADGGRTTWLGDYKITIPATENADTYFRLFMTEQLVSGTTYTISCKVSGLLDGSYYRFPLFAQSNTGMGLLYIDHNGLCSLTFTMNWTGTQTAATGANGETVYVNLLDDAARSLVSGQGPITLYDFKLEKGDTATPWCPADSELAIDRTIIRDSSGYNHNATLNSSLTLNADSPRYFSSSYFSPNIIATSNNLFNQGTLLSEFTWAGWVRRKYDDGKYKVIYSGPANIGLYNDYSLYIGWKSAKVDGTTTGNGAAGGSATVPLNTWTHICITYKDGIGNFYINGNKTKTFDYTSYGTFIEAYGQNYLGASNWDGDLSDIRIYTTALLDNDIKLLYNIGMRVDNLGGVHTFELEENQPNLMWRPENARAAGLGMNYNEGLGAYTQSNCQVTCDSNGYRIYRPPNLTVADNGNTMWGGLRIRNSTVSAVHAYDASIDNIFGLIKGHTYIFIITVEGKSSNNFSSIGITNLMGWGGGGLMPSPSNITYKLIGANFNGKTECYYKFTISDDIVKTCTAAYSTFVNGNQYLSYMDFMFGFAYESTGSLGTDLYISNIRLFDLTNKTSKNIQKSGIIEFTQFIEKEENITKIRNDEELYATEFIEI